MSKNLRIVNRVSICSLLLLGLLACDEQPPAVATWQHAAVGSLAASLSQDGRYALVSSVNHGAGFWDLEQNQLKFQWRHNDNPEDGITVSDISPDGSRAITADKRTFVIWNTSTGKAYGYWQAPADITAAALSDKARYVLLGLKNGKVIHIAMETGRRIEFTGHGKEPIAAVDLSPNGEWAFSGGQDYRAILWNTRTGQPRYIFSHQTRVTQVRLDTKGEQAFTSGTRGNAYVWDLTDGSQRSQLALKPREYVISSAAFSADGKLLATGAPGREVVLWETRSGQRLFSWKAKTRDQWKPSGAIVWAVAFDSEGKHVISEASSGFGQKWRIPPLP